MVFVLAWLTVGVFATARADEDPLAEAARRYDRGVELVRRGDDVAALAEFQAAHRLSARWEVLFNVGVTQKRLFRYGAAVRSFERYLAEGGTSVDPDRRRDVEAELAEIRALVAEVEVSVPGPPATLEVDGLVEGVTPLPAPILLAPGRHTVRATRDGQLPDEKTLELVSGQRAGVRLEPRPPPTVPTTAHVTIRSEPAGAALVIDQRAIGRAPWSGELTPGGHTVIAELPGHLRAIREVSVTAGQERTLTLELALIPPPETPFHQRRWVWATAAAVMVAGAATTYVLVTRPEATDVVVHWPSR